MKTRACYFLFLLLLLLAGWSIPCPAQPAVLTNAAPRGRSGRNAQRPATVEISEDRHATFRLVATNAINVRLVATDIPDTGNSVAMSKGTNGAWEVTLGPLEPGAYRYSFNVDGLSVVAPRNPGGTETFDITESGNGVSSLLYIPGAEFMDARDVPHGAIQTVTYFSKSLNRLRRMQVYTPPGYEGGSGKFPVLYLLHGFQDGDDAWATVGRAGFIMDNLIAANKSKPMILVMPSTQTSAGFGGFGGGGRRGGGRDEFGEDLLGDIIPFMDSHYRVYGDREHRAFAGMTSGGSQVLNLFLGTPDKFGYIGLFSTQANMMDGSATAWEQSHQTGLEDPKLKQNLKLLWASAGKDDPNIQQIRDTVGVLEKHGFKLQFGMSKGEATWGNWRLYLSQFAPLLFQ